MHNVDFPLVCILTFLLLIDSICYLCLSVFLLMVIGLEIAWRWGAVIFGGFEEGDEDLWYRSVGSGQGLRLDSEFVWSIISQPYSKWKVNSFQYGLSMWLVYFEVIFEFEWRQLGVSWPYSFGFWLLGELVFFSSSDGNNIKLNCIQYGTNTLFRRNILSKLLLTAGHISMRAYSLW